MVTAGVKPEQPKNYFHIWLDANRKELKQKFQGLSTQEFNHVVGKEWDACSSHVQEVRVMSHVHFYSLIIFSLMLFHLK